MLRAAATGLRGPVEKTDSCWSAFADCPSCMSPRAGTIASGRRTGDLVAESAFPTRARRRAIVRGVLLASDVVALLLATQLASFIRFGKLFHIGASPALPVWFNVIDLSFVMVGIWLVILWSEGLYDLSRVFWGTGEYTRVVRALTMGVIGVIFIEYVLRAIAISRGWTALAWGLGILFVICGRALVRGWMAYERRRGRLLRPTLIVGFNAEASGIINALRPAGFLPSLYFSTS